MLPTPTERTLTLKGQLALASFLSSELLYIPTVIIIILLLITFALLLYVILLKIAFKSRQRSRKRQFGIWENLILEYLSGEVSSDKIAKEVRTKDFSLFSEFMEKYLETLKGEDFQSLTHLLKEMGLFDYNLKRMGSRKRWHRVYAAFFLGLMRAKEAVPALQEGLKDRDYLMSFASASGLAKSGQKEHLEETLSLLTQRKDLGPDKAAEVLLEFGNGICSELASILNRGNIDNKWKYLIMDLLGYWHDLAAGPVLLKILHTSKDSEMKVRSIRSLGEMPYVEAAQALSNCLDGDNDLIRAEAVRALGRIGASEYSGKMVRSLSDKNWHVRYNAAQALASFGEEGMALLREMAEEADNSDVRGISAHLLSETELLGKESG